MPAHPHCGTVAQPATLLLQLFHPPSLINLQTAVFFTHAITIWFDNTDPSTTLLKPLHPAPARRPLITACRCYPPACACLQFYSSFVTNPKTEIGPCRRGGSRSTISQNGLSRVHSLARSGIGIPYGYRTQRRTVGKRKPKRKSENWMKNSCGCGCHINDKYPIRPIKHPT